MIYMVVITTVDHDNSTELFIVIVRKSSVNGAMCFMQMCMHSNRYYLWLAILIIVYRAVIYCAMITLS